VPTDLNITDEKYQTSSNDIQNHVVCFLPTELTYFTTYTDTIKNLTSKPPTITLKDSMLYASIVTRVIKVTQYRINNETYQFYKNVNTLLSASGKIFDPIAFQLQGNITCKTNPQKLALGFFEASSVRNNIYSIKPGERKVSPVKSYNLPSASGCVGGPTPSDPASVYPPPDFWVY
jgi:hypothetical protein